MQHIGCEQIGRRGRWWCAIALVLFAGLAGRLWCVQITHHEHYCELAGRRQGRRWPVQAPRGNIYDRNGNPLALNLELFSVAADPALVDSPDRLASELAPRLRMPERELREKLTAEKGVRYVRLRDSVDEVIAQGIRELECPGLIVSTGWKRAYPHRELAAGLLGFVGRDRKGLGGIEEALNPRLAGTEGEMLVMLDGRLPRSRSQIPGYSVVTKEMIPGSSAVLTIDLDIQAIAEEELGEAVESAGAAGGAAIVMDPWTGEVLALATRPGFDPNEFRRYPEKTWVSQAVVGAYEPGSTFKLVTACAALEEGVMTHGETFLCTGARRVGRHTISCALHDGRRAHGVMDLDHMVIKSCNVGMATVALALGPARTYRWARRLGFGEKAGIELAGESRGLLSPPQEWSRVQLANIGFGQGIAVTPLQLLRAYCAVANGGWLVHPHVVKAVTDATGRMEPAEQPKPVRALSAKTAEHMRALLVGVIEEGTGRRARIPGRQVAGKTGTAQKPTPEEGFHSGKYVGSFVGFAPARDPRIAVLVAIDEPKGAHYGGVVAAPAFQAICERALIYLRVPPDRPAPERELALAGPRG